MLLDVREGEGRRGYHTMAALTLMAPHLADVRLAALTSGDPDEGIALAVFRFDTGLDLPAWQAEPVADVSGEASSWRGRLWRRLGADRGRSFDLYAMIADRWPDDAVTGTARECARRTLLGLIGPSMMTSTPGITIVDGNDTRAFAATALSLLRPRPSWPRRV